MGHAPSGIFRLSWSRGHGLDVLARSLLTRHFAKCQEGMCELPERRNTSESIDSFFSYPDPDIIGDSKPAG